MSLIKILLFALILKRGVHPIWQPPYKVDLHTNQTFEIIEIFGDGLYDDDDEMIQKEQLKKLHFKEPKLFGLHKIANRRNAKEAKREVVKVVKIKERNFYHDEQDFKPWQAGFVDSKGSFIKQDNDNVLYLNTMAKNLVNAKIDEKKREKFELPRESEPEYDFDKLEAEYEAQVNESKALNETFKYKAVKEDESIKEAVGILAKLKQEPNCTSGQIKGIGLDAVKCYLEGSPKEKHRLGKKIVKIIIFWIALYVIIAIPLWCMKGWCCCCCWCKICNPYDSINEVKSFFAKNPLGTYHDVNDKIITYQPTAYERYYYKRIEKALHNL